MCLVRLPESFLILVSPLSTTLALNLASFYPNFAILTCGIFLRTKHERLFLRSPFFRGVSSVRRITCCAVLRLFMTLCEQMDLHLVQLSAFPQRDICLSQVEGWERFDGPEQEHGLIFVKTRSKCCMCFEGNASAKCSANSVQNAEKPAGAP